MREIKIIHIHPPISYICPSCGVENNIYEYRYKVIRNFHGDVKKIVEFLQCPRCSCKFNKKTVSKEEYESLYKRWN